MDRSGQFLSEGLIDQPLTLHSRQPLKGFGNNRDGKVAFAPGPGAGMAFMVVAVIHDLQPLGRKGFCQTGNDRLLYVTHKMLLTYDIGAVWNADFATSILECENFRLILRP